MMVGGVGTWEVAREGCQVVQRGVIEGAKRGVPGGQTRGSWMQVKTYIPVASFGKIVQHPDFFFSLSFSSCFSLFFCFFAIFFIIFFIFLLLFLLTLLSVIIIIIIIIIKNKHGIVD